MFTKKEIQSFSNEDITRFILHYNSIIDMCNDRLERAKYLFDAGRLSADKYYQRIEDWDNRKYQTIERLNRINKYKTV